MVTSLPFFPSPCIMQTEANDTYNREGKMQMDNCIIRITQMMDQMAPAEARIARYLLDQSSQALGQTIDQVADACDTSKTTVVRMCKTLGYKGYKDFSFAFSTSLLSGAHQRIAYADISPGDDLHTILSRVTEHSKAALTDTMRLLDEAMVEKTVDLLHKAARVDFYGVGISALVALDAQMKFQRLCKDTQTSFDPHVQVVTAARLGPGDVAVIFSYSGETADMLDTLEAVRRAGASVVSVTRYGPSRLSRAADIALHVASSEMLVRSQAMSSRICMMHITDLLFSAVAARGYEQYKPFLDKTHLEGRAKKRQKSRAAKEGDAV